MGIITKQRYTVALSTVILTFIINPTYGNLILTTSSSVCGGETILTCSSGSIGISDSFSWYIDNGTTRTQIYDHTQNGALYMNKYSGTINTGRLELVIHTTDVSDTNTYICNHNFADSNQLSLTACGHSGNLILTTSSSVCGGETILTCSSGSIGISDSFSWYIDNGTTRTQIYDHTQNGALYMNKYSGTINKGSLELVIYDTNVSDTNTYICNHNFTDSNHLSLALTCGQSADSVSGGISTGLVVGVVVGVVTGIAIIMLLILYSLGCLNPALRMCRLADLMRDNPICENAIAPDGAKEDKEVDLQEKLPTLSQTVAYESSNGIMPSDNSESFDPTLSFENPTSSQPPVEAHLADKKNKQSSSKTSRDPHLSSLPPLPS